jgi:probable F420-dependent oxidoreductase
VTQRITLGTAICLVVERDPITLAKEVASVDMLSGGRFVLGIGAGWNREEMENHGANYPRRWDLVREKVLAMKTIWREEAAEYHGEFVDFDPLWSYPKPVQAGGPPIWIGANSKWVFDRIAEYGDGWMPIGGLGSGNLERLQAACDARGRNVRDITLALFAAPTAEAALRGRIEQGFDELIFTLPSEPPEKVLPLLDELANLVATVRRG